MKRRDFLQTMGAGAAAMALPQILPAATAQEKRPNVILILTDDQGYGDLACHGNPSIRTPNLDKLHGESVRLTDFHVSPLCSPTRASLMTGRDPVRTGVWGTTWGRSLLRKDETTMADVFARSGYRTGHFGKWHLGDNYPFRPGDRGFQEVLRHGGGGVGQTPDYWGNDYFDDTYFHNGKPRKYTGYCTDVWFDAAMDFIEADKSRPFFCYIPTNAPHGPYRVAEEYSKPYKDMGIEERRAAFYGMITNIDDNVGRLRNKLKQLGIEENTILIFMTDNGTAAGIGRIKGRKVGYNAGMRAGKGSYYDGGHRVPCFIRWPGGGLAGGRDVRVLSAHIDLLPTLIDLCGLKAPEGVDFDGVSLAPALAGKTNALPDRTIFVQYRQDTLPPEKWHAAAMRGKWRLIKGNELYDIEADPGQAKNIAEQHPDIVKKLREDYERWWADVSRRFGEACCIVLGSNNENPARLTGFDWHTKSPWSQGHIRRGAKLNGHWAVEIERDGTYEFALRRWPEEVDKPITAPIPGGKAVKADKARLKIANVDQTKPIPKDAVSVKFTLHLKAGKTQMQTWLTDDETGESRGAYYVHVTRLA